MSADSDPAVRASAVVARMAAGSGAQDLLRRAGQHQVGGEHPDLVGQARVVVQPRHRPARARPPRRPPASASCWTRREHAVGPPPAGPSRPGRSSGRPGPRNGRRPRESHGRRASSWSAAAQVAEQAHGPRGRPRSARPAGRTRRSRRSTWARRSRIDCSIRSKSRMNVSDATTITTRLKMIDELVPPSRRSGVDAEQATSTKLTRMSTKMPDHGGDDAPGEPRRVADHPELVQRDMTRKMPNVPIAACSTIPWYAVLEDLAEHADEDALDDRVGQDQRRVGDPLEADDQADHQADQGGADPDRTDQVVEMSPGRPRPRPAPPDERRSRRAGRRCGRRRRRWSSGRCRPRWSTGDGVGRHRRSVARRVGWSRR